MAERHPSRTLLLVPQPDEPDGIDAQLSIRCFPIGDRAICGEVIELALRGRRAPRAGVDRAAAARSRICRSSAAGAASRRSAMPQFDQLIDDRRQADRRLDASGTDCPRRTRSSRRCSSRTPSPTSPGRAREPWRVGARALWPEIREQEISRPRARRRRRAARGLAARAARPRRSRSSIDDGTTCSTARLDGESCRPAGRPAEPERRSSSAELDRFSRDPVYEEAVRAAAASASQGPRATRSCLTRVRHVSDTRNRHGSVETVRLPIAGPGRAGCRLAILDRWLRLASRPSTRPTT